MSNDSHTPAAAPVVAPVLSEGLGPLRELATEGAALHSPGQPEHTVCTGLLAALDEVERLRAQVKQLDAREEGAKTAFAHVVDSKRDLERENTKLRGLLDAAYADIRRAAQRA
jgi:hypothetical protein